MMSLSINANGITGWVFRKANIRKVILGVSVIRPGYWRTTDGKSIGVNTGLVDILICFRTPMVWKAAR